MNYLPFCGYWFYGATNATQRAGFYSSYGLLGTVPGAAASVVPILMALYRRWRQ